MFQFIETIDELYRLAYAKAPFPAIGDEHSDILRMSFLICHRALLSAATLTCSGLPEDGAAITRRALEAADVCLAIKAHSDNLEIWRATQERTDRWVSRSTGVKPKRTINPHYKGLLGPLHHELKTASAVLSDATVHFTPEHVLGYEWEKSPREEGVVAFGVDDNEVAMASLIIADHHRLILRVFDHCLDGQILDQPQVKVIAARALQQFTDLLQREGFNEEASNIGENW